MAIHFNSLIFGYYCSPHSTRNLQPHLFKRALFFASKLPKPAPPKLVGKAATSQLIGFRPPSSFSKEIPDYPFMPFDDLFGHLNIERKPERYLRDELASVNLPPLERRFAFHLASFFATFSSIGSQKVSLLSPTGIPRYI